VSGFGTGLSAGRAAFSIELPWCIGGGAAGQWRVSEGVEWEPAQTRLTCD
jgi:hypothetical protein